jgi:hypothetical protein
MLFISVTNGAMNAPGHWELRAAFEIADTSAPYPYRAKKLHSLVGNSFLNCQQLLKWRGIFKGLSQDGGWADFSKNLRASLL